MFSYCFWCAIIIATKKSRTKNTHMSYNRYIMIINCNDYIWKSFFFSFRKCWHISLRLYPEISFWGGGELRPPQIRPCILYITHIALYYCLLYTILQLLLVSFKIMKFDLRLSNIICNVCSMFNPFPDILCNPIRAPQM